MVVNLSLSSLFAGWAVADEIQRRLSRDGLAELVAELGERLGPRRVEAASRLLDDVVAELGADAAVRGRRVRPPA